MTKRTNHEANEFAPLFAASRAGMPLRRDGETAPTVIAGAQRYDADGVEIGPSPTIISLAARAGQKYGRKLVQLSVTFAHRDIEALVDSGASGWLPDQVDGLTKEVLNECGIAFWRAARKALGWEV